MLFSQALIDCLTNDKAKNAGHNETVILNYNDGNTSVHILGKIAIWKRTVKVLFTNQAIKFCWVIRRVRAKDGLIASPVWFSIPPSTKRPLFDFYEMPLYERTYKHTSSWFVTVFFHFGDLRY